MGGTIILDGRNWKNSGTISSTSGFIFLLGTLDNRGSTLALNDTTGSYYLIYGSILGGIVSTTGNARLIATRDTPSVLDGVTLAGTLDLASFGAASLNVADGLTLDNGSITIAANSELNFVGTQALAGTGTVTFAATSTIARTARPGRRHADRHGGHPHRCTSGNVGSSPGGTIVDEGTVAADGGGTLTVQGADELAGGTLTGGTWEARGNSTLRVLGGVVATSAANLVLDGPVAHFYSDGGTTNALAGLATIAAPGSLSLRDGANLTTDAFNNQGSVAIGPGSGFSRPRASIRPPAARSSMVRSPRTALVTVNGGGSLAGSGTVVANVINNGLVTPGSSPGNPLRGWEITRRPRPAVLDTKVGGTTPGTQFDQLAISGMATLAGTLNVSLINGFGAAQGQSFPGDDVRRSRRDLHHVQRPAELSPDPVRRHSCANDLVLDAASTDADMGI